jgi:hypothetical protein
MHTKEKAPRHRAVEPNRIIVSREPTGAQNNGQARSEQRQIRFGPITKIACYGQMKFTQVLQDTVRDNRLSFGARGLLAYLLSQPEGWQPLSWHIKRDTGRSEYELRGYMKELRQYGYARLLNTAKGYKWEFCEFPNQAWLASGKAIYRISQGGNFDREKNDRVFKNDRIRARGDGQLRGSSKSRVQKKLKGENRKRAPRAVQASFVSSSSPKIPESESAMLSQLEVRGVQLTPFTKQIVHRFFTDMQSSGWRIRGEPVRDPCKALLARLEGIKRRSKNWGTTQERFLRMLSIASLKDRSERLIGQINTLYHQDANGTQADRTKLRARRDATDKELSRKTGRSVEVLRTQRGARRSEREHQAAKANETVVWEAEL